MSTTNPDETAREWRKRLVPAAGVIAIIGVALGPVLAAVNIAAGEDADLLVALLVYVFGSVAAGLFGYYVIRPTAWILAAYVLAYLGGLFLVMGSAAPLADSDSIVHGGFFIVAVPYAAALVCVILWGLRHGAVRQTRASGVDTTATVMSAGVDGMINYVQHQRLTLSFVDQDGVTRYFRTGITGGGYSAGDTIPIRYDPARPSSRRSILVGGQPYVSPDQQP